MSDAAPTRIVSCPTCGASAAWHERNAHRPFCSERCRLIDFGEWANERHSIPGKDGADELYSQDLAGSGADPDADRG
ncbi:MAG: DNA gyrase inhibitor YacG [Pseudomonadota bacterium]